jgi:cytochrome c oxidase subunit 1
MYMVVVTFAFFLGGLFRVDDPPRAGYGRRATSSPPDTYNKMFTMHGVAMVFFVLIPAVPAILGNFVLPLQLGAKDRGVPEAQPSSAGTSS